MARYLPASEIVALRQVQHTHTHTYTHTRTCDVFTINATNSKKTGENHIENTGAHVHGNYYCVSGSEWPGNTIQKNRARGHMHGTDHSLGVYYRRLTRRNSTARSSAGASRLPFLIYPLQWILILINHATARIVLTLAFAPVFVSQLQRHGQATGEATEAHAHRGQGAAKQPAKQPARVAWNMNCWVVGFCMGFPRRRQRLWPNPSQAIATPWQPSRWDSAPFALRAVSFPAILQLLLCMGFLPRYL
eukprot:COSAG05_NODE_1809_length_4041_cov_4.735921_1_plen_247_part_00